MEVWQIVVFGLASGVVFGVVFGIVQRMMDKRK
jgi:hypothetical protein